jgi:glycerophosphoryl diester phosphodiesterase
LAPPSEEDRRECTTDDATAGPSICDSVHDVAPHRSETLGTKARERKVSKVLVRRESISSLLSAFIVVDDRGIDMAARPQIIAHRGASKAERENTLAAFARAGRMGADAVELDVRRTADGVLVVHHDARLADERVIAACDHASLPDHVPTLTAALDACVGMWVNVEIKNDPTEPDFDPSDSIADETMAALIARDDHERWVISSFRIETIDRCRAIADGYDPPLPIRTAWLTVAVPDGTAEQLREAGHCALHPWVKLLGREVIDACHAAGIAVNTWTCDDPDRMAELIAWGIDGICTNVPDVALDISL